MNEHYRKKYQNSYDCEWFQKTHDWFTSVFVGHPIKFPELVFSNIPKRDEIKMLDIGAGSSDERPFGYLSMLNDLESKVHYRYLDPSKLQTSKFLDKIHKKGLDKIKLNTIRTMSFEDICSSPKHFDFVLSLHSFYGVEENLQYVKKFLDLISDDGRGMVVLAPNNDFPGKLYTEFSNRVIGGVQDNKRLNWPDLFYDGLTLERMHYKVDLIQEGVVLRDSLLRNDGTLNEDGEKLVSFFLLKQFSEYPTELKKDIRDFVKDQPICLDMLNYVFLIEK